MCAAIFASIGLEVDVRLCVVNESFFVSVSLSLDVFPFVVPLGVVNESFFVSVGLSLDVFCLFVSVGLSLDVFCFFVPLGLDGGVLSFFMPVVLILTTRLLLYYHHTQRDAHLFLRQLTKQTITHEPREGLT